MEASHPCDDDVLKHYLLRVHNTNVARKGPAMAAAGNNGSFVFTLCDLSFQWMPSGRVTHVCAGRALPEGFDHHAWNESA